MKLVIFTNLIGVTSFTVLNWSLFALSSSNDYRPVGASHRGRPRSLNNAYFIAATYF